MKLFKSVDKVLALMGSSKATERAHKNAFTEEMKEQIPGEQLGTSEHGGIWAVLQELNGYLFMEVIVLDTTKIKTFKGATLTFIGDTKLNLTSDSKELNSDFSSATKRWLTQISFEVSKKDVNYIRKKKFDQIQLDFKKKSLMFEAKK
jgi:hypothetical protein